MARRRRDLRPDERELWQEVARSARPLHKTFGVAAEAAETGAVPGVPKAAVSTRAAKTPVVMGPISDQDFDITDDFIAAMLAGFRPGARARAEPKVTLPVVPVMPLRMDPRKHRQLQRGKLAPEARLDLHGMTLAEAHPELIAFLFNAQAQGKRLVLVITGKGKSVEDPVPRPIGALRHQVPHWLRLAPMNAVVQEVSEAHLRHGGTGAFYIWLRRS